MTPAEPASPALSAAAFGRVRAFFREASGIDLKDGKHGLVANRLLRLAMDAGFHALDDYVGHVLGSRATDEERARLVDRLTINETYFFREPQHFEHLARVARAHREAGHRHEFLVWSAAAASGEEAFSAAMVLHDQLGTAPWRVIGTDLSGEMVATAQTALFPMERARHVPPADLQRHCLRGTGAYEGRILISRELRARVSFLQANLMAPPPELPRFDVVFLRNVLIYFEGEAKQALVSQVLGHLQPKGFLYAGHAEQLSGLGLPLRTVQTAVYALAKDGARPGG